jgi:hypothetical protein
VLAKKGDEIAKKVSSSITDAVAPSKRSSGTTVLGHYPEYVKA